MAALSGPASTMTVFFGEPTADFFTERSRVSWQGHGTEYVFQTREWMRTWCSATLEDVVTLLAGDHDGLAAIGGFAQLAEVSLELCDGRLHTNQII
jgi:hypothetical protein